MIQVYILTERVEAASTTATRVTPKRVNYNEIKWIHSNINK